MKVRFEIHCLGYRTTTPELHVAWGTLLRAITDDGREQVTTKVGSLDSATTKNAADLMAVVKALQCIKPEFRVDSDVVIYTPPGYVYQMLERQADGSWGTEPGKNADIVGAMRAMTTKYNKLEIRRGEPNSKPFRQVVEIIQKWVSDARMGTNKGTGQVPSSTETARTPVSRPSKT